MCLLKVVDLSKRYENQETDALSSLSFSLSKKTILGIVGSSGSGKSTLLKLLAGHLSPTSGVLFLENSQLQDPADQLLKGYPEIAYVQQDFQLPPKHTVIQNLRYPLRRYNQDYQKERVAYLLELMHLQGFENQRTETLSGGQKQRLAIAQALSDDPKILLLDEPFNQLDIYARMAYMAEVQQLVAATDLAVVMVSHEPSDVLPVADHVMVLAEGRLKEEGSPYQLYRSPKHAYTAQLFGFVNQFSARQLSEEWGMAVGNDECYGLRPEHVRLNSGHQQMKVVEIKFLGPMSLLKLTTESGLSIQTLVQEGIHNLKIGQEIFVGIDRENIFPMQVE